MTLPASRTFATLQLFKVWEKIVEPLGEGGTQQLDGVYYTR
jgi:hypothetical protein